MTELRRWGKGLVYTAHDLRNPHHLDRRQHDAHLDVLVPAADEVITLTPGAADEISRRWGRRPVVLPHPHVIEFGRFRPRRNGADEWTVGVHAEERARQHGPPAGHRRARRRRGRPARRPPAGQRPPRRRRHRRRPARPGPDAMAAGRPRGRGSSICVVHDCFSDEELWQYLESLDLSVLPYRFGTHSGWLEACFDLGTTVLAPTCGYFAQQRPCLTYRHDERGLDVPSLQAAVRTAYEQRPLWQARLDGPATGAHRASGRPPRCLRRGPAMTPPSDRDHRVGSPRDPGTLRRRAGGAHLGPRACPPAARS